MQAVQGSTRAERIAAVAFDYEAQAMERVAACNLCGARGEDVVRAADRDRYGYRARLLVCRRCGLGWLSPRMTAQAYARFYDGVYRPLVSAYHGRRIDAASLQLEQRAYAARLATFLAPRMPSRPLTILDVGGSTGVVAGVLAARFGASATVLDPAPDELGVAAAAGLETIAGPAEDFDAGGRRWDLVLLCQTIDHLLDVRGTLAGLRRATARGGRAFVDILDTELVLQRTGAIQQVVKIDHPHYLTRETARALFSLAGYDVLAERASPDGHRGFVLAPATPGEPDRQALRRDATALIGRIGKA